MKEKLQVYVGTFSTNFFSLKFDLDTLEAEDLHAIHDPGGRSAYFAYDEDEKYLYIGNEWERGDGGIAAFRLTDGDPVFLNAIPSNSQGPAHISTVKAYGKTFVLGAGYFEGDVMVCPTAEDGSLLPMTEYLKLVDISHVADAGRAHGIKAVPGTNFVIVTDTINGQIFTFELTEEGKLESRFIFDDPALRFPRHMTFSKDGAKMYLLTERGNSLEAFDINRETGELTHFYSCSTLPDEFRADPENMKEKYRTPDGRYLPPMASAIHRSPDGKFVYVTNRGHESVTTFRVDGEKIEKVGYTTDAVCWPREFMITPDGDYMLLGNQIPFTVSVYKINHETGIPEYTGKQFSLPFGPGPVSFISVPKTED